MGELLRNARHDLTSSSLAKTKERLDCHANLCGLSRNDENGTDSVIYLLDCYDYATQNLAMTTPNLAYFFATLNALGA